MLNIFKPEVIPNCDEIELENVCRICFHTAKNTLSVFHDGIDCLISEFLPQKLQLKPSQPHQICTKCFAKAKIAYKFKKQCQFADELIKSMLNEPNISKTFSEKHTQTDISYFIYPCEKCEKKFESSEILKEHRLNEHSNNICRTCGKVFSNIATLKDHLISVHHELGFLNHKCHLCEKFFNKKMDLRRHLFKIHNVNEYFKKKDKTNCLIEEDSIFAKIGKNEFACGNCLEYFEVEDDLKNHECTTFLYEKVLDGNSSNWLQLINDCDENEIEILSASEENNDYDPVFVDNLKTYDEYEENEFEQNEEQKFYPEIEISTEKIFVEELKVSQEIFGAVITDSKEQLTREMNTNDNPKQFDCIMCSKSFTRKDHLQRHVKSTHIGKKNGKKQMDLKYHMNQKINCSTDKGNRKKTVFPCKICMIEFISEKILRSHIAVVHNATKEFSCKYCLEKIIGEVEYEKHCKGHGTALAKRYHCPVCKTSFKRSYNLNCHLTRHTGEKPYKCEYCNKAFPSQSNLHRHTRTHTGEKNYHCTKCPKSFIQSCTLKAHLRTHSDERPLKCSLCPKAFKDNISLKQHSKKHTGGPSYCDICGLRYSSSIVVLSHKRKVHGIDKDKEFTCKICSEKIIGALEYKEHCKVHIANEKPHKSNTKSRICKECGAAFKQSNELKMHIRTHTGEKPFKCVYCDKAFASPSNLYRHTKTHTGEKNYHCPSCPMSFIQSNSLQSHMRTHTGEKPYKCSRCPAAFTENRALKKHLGKHT